MKIMPKPENTTPRAGDVVRLRSGGALITVGSVYRRGGQQWARCFWLNDLAEFETGDLPVAALK